MRIRFALRGAALAFILLTSTVAGAATIALPGPDGTTIELDRPASRLITLAPHLAELTYAAGAGDLLLATVAYSDFPAAAEALPRIGDAFRFDLERIVSMKPDLVLAWDSGNPEPALNALEGLGVRVWRTAVDGPDAIATLLDQIGRATGRESIAAARSAPLRERIEGLRAAHRERAPVRYFYQVAERPLYTINGTHPISRGLAICGGENVFGALGTLAPQISAEAVLREDPQVMVAGRLPGGAESLAHWRAWPRLRAVRDEALFYLHADRINRATPRMLDALEEACRLFDDYRARAVSAGGHNAHG